jgi:hypothetical protein
VISEVASDEHACSVFVKLWKKIFNCMENFNIKYKLKRELWKLYCG